MTLQHMEQLRRISFDHSKTSGLEFDLLRVEEILARKHMDHNPENPHRLDFYALLFIVEGHGRHTIDFQDYAYQKGSVITVRKNQIHQFHSSNSKGILLIFTEEFVISYLEQHEANKIVKIFNELLNPQYTELSESSYEEMRTLIHQMQVEFNKEIDEHSASILRNLLQAFMSKLYRIRAQELRRDLDHRYMNQFIRFQALVEEECTIHRNVTYYANKLNITTRTLNTITNSILQKPSKSFIDEVLSLQIKRMLINTDLSIKEIAYQSGFNEPTNLFKYFRKITGLTPESFRSMHTIST